MIPNEAELYVLFFRIPSPSLSRHVLNLHRYKLNVAFFIKESKKKLKRWKHELNSLERSENVKRRG